MLLRAFIASFVGDGDENLVCSSGFDHVKAFAPSRELNRVADFLCALYCNKFAKISIKGIKGLLYVGLEIFNPYAISKYLKFYSKHIIYYCNLRINI